MSVVTDPIADFLTRIRNGMRARKSEVVIPYSKMKREIAEILKKEGYVASVELDTTGTHPQLRVATKFVDKLPAITGLKRVSRPGLRKYVSVDEIPRVLGGMGVAILSTPQGILTGREAKRRKVGGELVAFVW
jgi:small subunit ribosomal protein S8